MPRILGGMNVSMAVLRDSGGDLADYELSLGEEQLEDEDEAVDEAEPVEEPATAKKKLDVCCPHCYWYRQYPELYSNDEELRSAKRRLSRHHRKDRPDCKANLKYYTSD